jgi:hypothetical protein
MIILLAFHVYFMAIISSKVCALYDGRCRQQFLCTHCSGDGVLPLHYSRHCRLCMLGTLVIHLFSASCSLHSWVRLKTMLRCRRHPHTHGV